VGLTIAATSVVYLAAGLFLALAPLLFVDRESFTLRAEFSGKEARAAAILAGASRDLFRKP
jgi:hypothetical protein